MAIKKRCIRCLKPLREDGTCENPGCVKYVPDPIGAFVIRPEVEGKKLYPISMVDDKGNLVWSVKETQ